MARSITLWALAAVASIACGSCASVARSGDRTGRRIDDVVAEKGPPTSIQ
ncbi:MAG TPA: hypothetical protein VMT19_07165 [Thermoanaerobaculaceae bacterium]|nr:hypothetical protein [Thermoanaerobaculaceae bacterium]